MSHDFRHRKFAAGDYRKSFINRVGKLKINKMKLSVQNAIRMTMAALLIVVGLSMKSAAQAQEKFILSTTEFTVKNGHEKQFEDGVKAWKACYLENKGEWTWNMWQRYNGKGSVYVLSSRSANWAEFDDENDEAGKKCHQIVMYQITPHIESSENNFAVSMPELSKTSAAEMGVIWVSFFQTENSVAFKEVVTEISNVMKKVEGDNRSYWYDVEGGRPEGADYFVTTPYKNFAALDIKRDGVWDMVEKAKGKEETEKLRAKMRASLKDSWAYLYKHMDDLSHNPVQ
jgi:hypothetical protein